MTTIDKIRAEIKKRRLHFNKEAEKYQALNNGYSQNCYGARDALRDLENFLDTLEEPASDCHDLEEAADEWCKTNNKGIALCADKKSHYLAEGIDAFIAGAEWMKKQIPMPEDTVIFQKGVEEGKRLMMEGATYNELMELYMAIRDEIIKRHRDAAVNIKEKTMDLKEDTGNESALHQIRG